MNNQTYFSGEGAAGCLPGSNPDNLLFTQFVEVLRYYLPEVPVPEEFLGALKYALASDWDEENYQAFLKELGL